jgi:hypothetical protein
LEALKRRDKGLLRHEKIFLSGEERVFSRRQARGGRQNIKVQNPNDKWLMSYDKRTPARPLLAVIGPVFAFRGLLSSVSGLVFAVCRPPSSVLIITNANNGHGHETLSEREFGQQAANQ